MSNSLLPPEPNDTPDGHRSPVGEYVVVARRYRPQTFDELIGQEHVGRALSNAIATHRVGHAYLFTGARGVGKTSAARIFAKSLNCQQGVVAQPCGKCDICQAIAGGDDVDVLEIDGASNRGIDEIRQLRQTVAVRPSRSRFKIYIIDEVHMLTREAFNALLKTLEEPPEHVKFIFCTTEAEKIPITILSRCQRFDFAGIQMRSIAERLAQIVSAEGVAAEPAALELLARRAAGSMRDSQSLLEQLLSFGGERLTLAGVHALLGTADDHRISAMLANIVSGDAAGALAEMDAAVASGVDVGRLLDQLLGMMRDVLVASVGASPEAFIYTSPGGEAAIVAAAAALRPSRVMAVMQIFDHALGRLRYSTQTRIIAELAVVRAATLDDLDDLTRLVDELRDGGAGPAPTRPATRSVVAGAAPKLTGGASAAASAASVAESSVGAGAKKNVLSGARTEASAGFRSSSHGGLPSATAVAEPVAASTADLSQLDLSRLSEHEIRELWERALSEVVGMLQTQAAACESIKLQPPNRLVAQFAARYSSAKNYCERPSQSAKLEQALSTAVGQAVKIEFALLPAASNAAESVAAPSDGPPRPKSRPSARRDHPLVRHAAELFDADVAWMDEPPKPPEAT